jgi:hypothetical protein
MDSNKGLDLCEIVDEEVLRHFIENIKKQFQEEDDEDDEDDEWIKEIEKKIKGE